MAFAANPPRAVNGALDLRNVDLASGEVVPLQGEWALYPGVRPNSVGILPAESDRITVKVPGFWTEVASEDIPAMGMATYGLRVQLPENSPQLSIKVSTVWTSYELWANGQKITAVGVPGASDATAEPAFKVKLETLPHANKELQLYMVVSNFHHHRGGSIGAGISLAEEHSHFSHWKRGLLLETVSAAFILMAILYHLILFLYYRTEKSYLYFSLLVLAGLIRQVCSGDILIAELVPDFPFELNQRLRYIGFVLAIGYGVLYAQYLTRAIFPRLLARVALWVSWVFVLFIAVVPMHIASFAILGFQFAGLALFAYTMILLLGARKYYEVEARYLLIGALIFSGMLIYDLLVAQQIISGVFVQPIGYPLFVLSQIILLAIRHRRVRYQAETLSEEVTKANVKLAAYNRDLEKKVVERTREVVEQKDLIESQNDRLLELNDFKTNFTSMLVHDLKNPINVILNSGASKSDDTVKRSGIQMLQLVSNLLDLNKHEESQLVLSLADRSLRAILVEAVLQMEVFANEKSVEIVLVVDEKTTVYADEELIGRVVVNMLSNAIKFAPFGSQVHLTANAHSEDVVEIRVKDQGSGLKPELQEIVFEKNTSLERSRIGHFRSTGLGLAFCKMVLEAHNGGIGVESEFGHGATFWFQLAGKYDAFTEARHANEERITVGFQAADLSEEELAQVRPIATEIRPMPVYRATQIVEVLDQLPESSPAIAAWKQQVKNALFNSDKDHLAATLAQVLD